VAQRDVPDPAPLPAPGPGFDPARASVAELRAAVRGERLLTVPNALSLLRLAGVPLLLYLLIGLQADGWAIVVLAVGGLTDWADGKLARLLGQYSHVGAMLDPAVDRLYILAALVALGVREIVPWWAIGVLVARDLVLALTLPLLRRRGFGPYPVTYVGKGATFLLLYAFPLVLLGQTDTWAGPIALPLGLAFGIWGTALYLYSGLLYLAQFVLAMRTPTPAGRAAGP
jgi:cardiolipin synthase (CMP-forming)